MAIVDIHGHTNAPPTLYAYKAGLLASKGAHGKGNPNLSEEAIGNAVKNHLANNLDKVGTDVQFLSPRPFQLMHSEKAKAFDSYYAYYGTWTVDAAQKTVTHHIRQSLDPGERGEDGVRHYVVDGDRLILTAKFPEMGEEHRRKLVWQRLSRE